MGCMEFGKIVEKLIYFSGQKNYSLAKELGYDVSYISKWISGTMLPASKNIKIICDKIAYFIINNTNEYSKKEIIDYFNINIETCNTEEILKQHIEEILNQSYLISQQHKYKKNTNKKKESYDINNSYNSKIHVNPRFVRKYLDENIMKLNNNEIYNDVIILGDLFSLSRDDSLHIAGIRNGSALKTELSNTKIRFLISFDENIDDIIFNTLLFINMIMIYSNIDFNLYSCKHSQYSLMVAIKNNSFHQSVYTDTHKCIFVNTSQEKGVVEDMYVSLEEMIKTRSMLTFLEKNSREMILEKKYIHYIIGKDLKWIIGNINELLMPSDLFLEIGQKVFGNSEEVLNELKNIDAILQNATYNSDIELLIYDIAIRQYISNGKLNFFNTTITLTVEERQRHIEYMEKLFRKNKNIDVKLITGSLVEDFKSMESPSIYISKSFNFIKINDSISEENKYLIVKDHRLDKIFKRFFQEVWNTKKDNITQTREDAVDRITDSLNYINILKNTIE